MVTKAKKLNSKCQNCGSELVYNPKTSCLTCRHCETNYFLPQKNNDAVLVRQYSPSFTPNQLNRALVAYKCNSCGNTYFITSEEMSKKCPNCGSNSCSLVEDDGYCADGIVPFKITREQASEEFAKYLKKQRNIPSNLKKLAKDQKLMGVFIPVWNFKFNIEAQYSARATEVKQNSDGTFYSTYKPIYGEKNKRVASLDQSATTAESDEFLELFDEKDYVDIIPYTPEYTFGYRVDKINKDIHDYYHEVSKKAEDAMKKEITKTVLSSHKEVSDLFVDCKANDVFFNFTYVPVYVNTYTYRGKLFRTYISGTSGKVIGKTPITIKKIFATILKILGLAAFIALIILIIRS